jgi:hypothetical protein
MRKYFVRLSDRSCAYENDEDSAATPRGTTKPFAWRMTAMAVDRRRYVKMSDLMALLRAVR